MFFFDKVLLPTLALNSLRINQYDEKTFVTYYLLLVGNVKAEQVNVLICNGCSSTADYSNLAKTMGEGTAIIMNLTTSQAKAYNVVPSQHIPGSYIAMNIALPDYVMESINGYNQLKAAFEAYSAVSAGMNQSTLMNQMQNTGTLSSSSANGCGSPSAFTYPGIPDFPFRDACDMHDVCYTTSRSKSSCDGEFLYNMNARIEEMKANSPEWVWWVSPAGVLLFNMLMEGQAELYHFAVVTSETARGAYCTNTAAIAAPECRPRRPATGGTYEGTQINQIAGSGGETLTQRCELWSFDDGMGGLYYMWRNCTFS